jgi:hypothetical protein
MHFRPPSPLSLGAVALHVLVFILCLCLCLCLCLSFVSVSMFAEKRHCFACNARSQGEGEMRSSAAWLSILFVRFLFLFGGFLGLSARAVPSLNFIQT